ncbi:hypothetical protein [Flavobacterium beibuense]|uniref:Uncharacterized protein n=1 Tax=Flavobacterium beibuense TaxID=657326 RepID=A0A444WF35_9FLAO|nr:hypothetical protein [Flavobacterium beibuense]RYJ44437.1 hypothetical protein NU09_1047 [Flavobacterium beibuense]
MKKLIYILLLLPFAVMAQETPSVNGYKTFLDNKQVDITHYFIDPDNVADIRTDKNTKEVYITRKEQTDLVCLGDLIKDNKINVTVNGTVIENHETYFMETTTITDMNIDKTTEIPSINFTTKNNRKE